MSIIVKLIMKPFVVRRVSKIVSMAPKFRRIPTS